MKLLKTAFKFKRSTNLVIIFLFIHIGALFCVNSSVETMRPLLVLCILMNLFVVTRIYALGSVNDSIIGFRFIGGDKWVLTLASKRGVEGFLKNPIFVSNYLIIMNFMFDKRVLERSLLVSYDSLSKDEFRKLKVILKTN